MPPNSSALFTAYTMQASDQVDFDNHLIRDDDNMPFFQEFSDPQPDYKFFFIDSTLDMTPPDSPLHAQEKQAFRSQLVDNTYFPVETIMDRAQNDTMRWCSEVEVDLGFWTPPNSPEPENDSLPARSLFPNQVAITNDQSYDDIRVTRAPHNSKKRKQTPGSVEKRKKTVPKSSGFRPEKIEEAIYTFDLDDDSSDDPENKRQTHNVLERKRRTELKYSYQILREEIPNLQSHDKTPTGLILNRACEYISQLKEMEELLLRDIRIMKEDNMRLLSLVSLSC